MVDDLLETSSSTSHNSDDDQSTVSEGSAHAADNDLSRKDAAKDAFQKHIHHYEAPLGKQVTSDTDGTTDANIDTESARIIDRVRDYQQELFERAKEENVIAVLDTGSGKTLIACLLIRHTLELERLRRVEGHMQKVICFLACSVHLVQQQARVLANNLIEQPTIFYGSSNLEWRSTATWDRIKADNPVVVCTPAILDQVLSYGFLKIEEIALLVFDEAHHAKKDHPYSRLIRSYYLKAPQHARPRIFGMTASAVDTKGDITTTAHSLEELLHSKIVTTKDGSLFSFAPKPTDVRWTYGRSRHHFSTELCNELSNRVGFCALLTHGFSFAKSATRELGPWCANHAWTYVMGTSANQSLAVRRKYEQSEEYSQLPTIEVKESRLLALDEASLLVQQHAYEDLTASLKDLSPKVLMLYRKLLEQYEQNPDTRAIVFVDERLKVLVLHDCFQKLRVPNLRPGTLLGSAGTASEIVSIRKQENTLDYFRTGLVNLVFATSVADEGLDIPQCNLCIRFDPCKTTIQYMQSRGRARMSGSIFAHMVEEGDFDHKSELDYQIASEEYFKRWCSTLAPDRRLGKGTQLSKLIAKDEGGKTFQTDTGARCDNSNALVILARFTASLRHTGATDLEVYQVEIDVEKNLFRYGVRLPDNEECAIKGCRGDWKPNKQLAKRSAAWSCCFLLRKHGQLDDNLDSKYRKIKPHNFNARLAVSAKRTAYDMQVKPSQWDDDVGSLPQRLSATIITFIPERPLRNPLHPLVLLTRHPLPVMPSFSAYLEGSVQVKINPRRLEHLLPVNLEQLNSLTTFTLKGVFEDVFNKSYAHHPEMMSYWLAPLSADALEAAQALTELVDPSALKVLPSERIVWSSGMSKQLWERKFLADPLNGKFHYFTGQVIPGKKITDQIPDGIPHVTQKKRGNIIDFSNSTWTATKKKINDSDSYDIDQPVLEAQLIGTKRNFLDPSVKQDLIDCHIAPQFLQIARIDKGFGASCLVWPAILHRLESYMITLEAFSKLELSGIPAALALEAFTQDADNDLGEAQTHTGGTRGMGKNYERLEFIGDSLLKMTTTLAVFVRTTCDEEGMHCRRMEMLCNRTLFNVATTEDLQLHRYARTLGFDRTTWYPEHLVLLAGRGAKKDAAPGKHAPVSQNLGMKTIADMSEAIIGATILATEHLPLSSQRFDLPIQAVTKLTRSPDHSASSWAELVAPYKAPGWSIRTNDPEARYRADKIKAITGYDFRYPCLLRSALTHSSDINSPVPDLQRLEFLGDAVLDYVSISWLFNNNPTRDPQWLTEHKMAMVSNQFLAALAVKLNLDTLMFATTTKLLGTIKTYAAKVNEILKQPDHEMAFWMDIESPPKALSDLVESYLGAVLVDSNFDYCEIEKFFAQHVKPFFENINDYDGFAHKHPTTYLHSRLGQDFRCRDYRVMDGERPAPEGSLEPSIMAGVLIHNKVISDAIGASARYARVRASKAALVKLEGLTREEFMLKYGCDCATTSA